MKICEIGFVNMAMEEKELLKIVQQAVKCEVFEPGEYGMTAICGEDVITVHSEGVDLFLGGSAGVSRAKKLKNRLLMEVDADEMYFRLEGLEERIY